MIHRLLLFATVAFLPILPGDDPQPAPSPEHRRPHEGVTVGKAPSAGQRLIICPAPKAPWQASLQDVEKVLYSAAGELWVFFPDRSLKPILVEPKGGPITLYKRGPNGEFRVRLATGKTYWSQYAFQFAHEFCHVLCNYREDGRGNKWFEEALCEVASLFALGRMAETWKTAPPYPNWKSYAPHYGNTPTRESNKPPCPRIPRSPGGMGATRNNSARAPIPATKAVSWRASFCRCLRNIPSIGKRSVT